MRRAVTPVIAIILLALMTVSASGLAFVWINSVSTNIQESTGAEITSSPGSDCSRLNIISMRGDSVIVQNVGCDTVSSANVLINGQLTSYDLTEPLSPGQATSITYNNLAVGQDGCVKVALGNGAYTEACTRASDATIEAGFSNGNSWYSGCNVGVDVVNFDGNLNFNLDDDLACGCDASYPSTEINNPGFESGETGWDFQNTEVVVKDASNAGYINWDTVSTDNFALISKDFEGQLESINFKAFISSNSEGERHTSVFITYTNNSDSYMIIYVLDSGGGIAGLCETSPGNPNQFINCDYNMTNYPGTLDSWVDYSITDIYDDFANTWTEVDFSTLPSSIVWVVGQNPFAPGLAQAYFDDFSVSYTVTGEGMVCDEGNVDGIADGACISGVCTSQTSDDNQYFCVSPNLWFTDNTNHWWDEDDLDYENNGPCCGDDGIIDDFTNNTMLCESGVYRDLTYDESNTVCENAGYVWFDGQGYNDYSNCCGDDGILDNFFIGESYCCQGNDFYDCTDNGIGDKVCGCDGASITDTCGDNLCQAWENYTTCSYDCNYWSEPVWLTDNPTTNAGLPLVLCNESDISVVYWENGAKVFNSTNGGLTWSEPYYVHGYQAKRFISNETAYLFSYLDSSGYPALHNLTRSYDGGNWGNSSTVIENTDGYSTYYLEDIYYSNSKIHGLVFNNTDNRELYYFNSDDGGYTWSDYDYIDNNVSTIDSYKVNMFVETDSNLFIFYKKESVTTTWDVYYVNSSDNGDTWGSPQNATIIDDYQSLAHGVNSFGDTLYLSWTDLSQGDGAYFRKSVDNGVTWSDVTKISNHNNNIVGPLILSNNTSIEILFFDNKFLHLRSVDSGTTWFVEEEDYENFNNAYGITGCLVNNEIHLVYNNVNTLREIAYMKYGK